MKTSMLGAKRRQALVAAWLKVMEKGVVDKDGAQLFPGDLVRLPICVRRGSGPDIDVPGAVTGYAVGKDGMPSVVVDVLAWNGRRMTTWRTWIVGSKSCQKISERDIPVLVVDLAAEGIAITPSRRLYLDEGAREGVGSSWLKVVLDGVRTKGGVAIRPGDLVRLPRNVARNRGSQLHAAGTCLGFAAGLDGSPCVVVDAVGEDSPELTRWRTWVVRGDECLVIDNKEAWRLEGFYQRDGRPKLRLSKPHAGR